MSFEIILPFLRAIEPLIRDPEISEIMVNPGSRVFIERQGKVEEVKGITLDERHLRVAVQNIARRLGDDISDEKPILDSRLPDGSRVAAMVPPCSVGGVVLTIRKFQNRWFSLHELVKGGAMPSDIAQFLQAEVTTRRNILISGGAGCGKTTLLNALTNCIPDDERLAIIEDTSEIQTEKENVLRFEARPELPSLPAVTIRDLLKASLRHRPDRIIVGEVRGAEAFELLQALNTGHAGSLSTIHANSCSQAISRFVNCVLQSGVELPYVAIRGNIAELIDVIIQVERRQGRRLVTEVVQLKFGGVDGDKLEMNKVYQSDLH